MGVVAALSYAVGQCTYGVAQLLSWVPAGWGNAREWLGHAQAQGYTISRVPVTGSVAVWASPGGVDNVSADGHVAEVIGVQSNGAPIVREMNFLGAGGGPGRYDVRPLTPSEAAQVSGYILDPSSTGGVHPGSTAGIDTLVPPSVTQSAASLGTCLTLGQSIGAASLPVISGVPVVGSIQQGAQGFFSWISQGCVWKRLLIQGGSLLLILMGMRMLGGEARNVSIGITDPFKRGSAEVAATIRRPTPPTQPAAKPTAKAVA